MRARMNGRQNEPAEDERWWRLDFTMVLLLLVMAAFVVLVGYEFWHSHGGTH